MNIRRLYQQLSLGLVILILATLGGCGLMHFQAPAPNSSVSSPVTVEVNWTADMEPGTSPEILLDGTNIYSSTLFSSTGSRSVQGSVDVCTGPHTLEAWGHIYCWYCGAGNSYPRVGTTIQITAGNATARSISITPTPIDINAGISATATLTLSAASTSSASVTLTPAANVQINNGLAGQPVTVTVPANQTSTTFNVKSDVAGSSVLAATGAGLCNETVAINVRPVINSLSTASGAPGSNITIFGRGFAQGASVRFGQTSATSQWVSTTQLNVTVPANASGTQAVTVLVAGQTSNAINFTITAPPPVTPVVFRASGSDVQSFNFSAPGSPSLINTQNATLSPGMLVVGLSYNASNVLVRSSSQDVQTFNVNASGQLANGTAVPATLSPVGAAVFALSSGTIIRASASDLQVFNLAGGNLTLQGSIGAALSSTGTGVGHTVLSNRTLAVRGYASGIEVFDITQPSAITLRGNNNSSGLSSTGVGLRVVASRAIRAYSGGLEVYDLTTATPTRTASNISGALSGTGVAVDSDALLARIVRATDSGIEVYQLNGTTLAKLGQRNGALSPTGVAVALVGNRVFRAYSSGIEEYDISVPANIPAPSNIAATLSSTGVGISVRP